MCASLVGSEMCIRDSWVSIGPEVHVRGRARAWIARRQALARYPEDHCSELWQGRAGRHCQGGGGG
eukprot:13049309-Alexandrium_andersonii.AAC.1